MSSGFSAPPRTVSSGTPVTESRLEDFRTNSKPFRASSGAKSTSPAPPPRMSSNDDDDAGTAAAAPAIPLPAGLRKFYPVADFFDLSRNGNPSRVPRFLGELGSKLWPEDTQRPAATPDMWSRDMFSDKERTVKDRKLANMVLGILGRITPENYEQMKKELCDLPIRQSTDDEVTDVVNMMYTKAVRPEDELYTELYARLMSDLVKHTGVEGVGKTIRKAIIDKCQQQFEKPFRLADDELVDADGNDVPQEEIDAKKAQLKAKLRANIKFLGHIFLSKMVNEKVVNYVLYHLLYGRTDEPTKKRRPEEYELEMFVDLLRKVVKQLSKKTLEEYLPGYMTSLENLMPKVSKRIMFMLQDLQELYKNNWVDKRRHVAGRTSGPVKLDEFEKLDAEQRAREQRDFERAAARPKVSSPKTAAPSRQAPQPSTPAVPLPKKDEVYDVMDAFRQEGGVPSLLEDFFKPIPGKERGAYVTHWVLRIFKQLRMSEDRCKFGEVVEALRMSNLMQASEIERCMVDVATQILVEGLLDENTKKLSTGWAEIVNSCRQTVTQDAHTFLLRALIRGGEYPTPVEVIITFIDTVLRAPDPHAQHRDPMRRFRPLPPILQYQNVLPDPEIADEDVDEEAEDTGFDDLLASVVAKMQPADGCDAEVIDPEIAVFDNLSANVDAAQIQNFVRNHASRTEPLFVAKMAGAMFSYVRCDTTGLAIERLREPLMTIATSAQGNDAVVLQEAFMMWNQLGKSPAPSLGRFVERLTTLGVVNYNSLERAHKAIEPRMSKDFCEATGFKPNAGGGGAARAGGNRR